MDFIKCLVYVSLYFMFRIPFSYLFQSTHFPVSAMSSFQIVLVLLQMPLFCPFSCQMVPEIGLFGTIILRYLIKPQMMKVCLPQWLLIRLLVMS